ncbi:MAG: N(G),N(G)-dimethylarginine dimethylaminohydrolase [Desulfobacteraceae bacterium]|nr:N(G),N(G)-dimethylarginine dimethylaminohydrolase [Desulfobacteraceae bacterium]
MFTKAVVKRPCRNMVKGISRANLGKPDYFLAIKQHGQYVKALESCGLDVTVLEADEAFADSTFIEDTCLVTPSCAVITNPGAETRNGEIHKVRTSMEEFGLPMEEIQTPGTLDGGDVMMAGNHYYVGLSQRTNREGFEQLRSILKKYKMTASAIPLTTVLHLKTGISYLENNYLLAHGKFLTLPEFQKFSILPVDEQEAYAANCIWINDQVIWPKGFPKTKKMIKEKGFNIIEVDVSEFRKLDGGLSCLSLRF